MNKEIFLCYNAITVQPGKAMTAVGRVRATGPDATRLAPGEWVFCDPTVRARDDALAPNIMLQGWTAPTEGAQRLQQWMRDGAFSEQMRLPMECVFPLGDIAPAAASRWCAAVVMLVPYGGWLASGLQPGETALVNTATGNFGSAAVAVALAMGAGAVLAAGRNEAALTDLVCRFGARVRSGLLPLDHVDITEFTLVGINEAITHATAHAGAFRLTVLRP